MLIALCTPACLIINSLVFGDMNFFSVIIIINMYLWETNTDCYGMNKSSLSSCLCILDVNLM